jgi:beta-xylosidase
MFGSRKHRVDDDALPFTVPKIPSDTFPIILSFINLTHQEYAKLSLINKTCYEELQKNVHWISPCRYHFGYKLTGKERESLKEIYIRKTNEYKEKREIENNRIRLVTHILVTNL